MIREDPFSESLLRETFFGGSKSEANGIVRDGLSFSWIPVADVITATEDMPLSEVTELMLRGHIKRLPVVNAGRVTGIISRADLAKVVSMLPIGPSSADDMAIRKPLQSELGSHELHSLEEIHFIVRDGTVEFWGDA